MPNPLHIRQNKGVGIENKKRRLFFTDSWEFGCEEVFDNIFGENVLVILTCRISKTEKFPDDILKEKIFISQFL